MRKSILLTAALTVIYSMTCLGQWFIQNNPSNEKLNAVYFVSATAGMAVGDNGVMVRTANGGVNWDTVNRVTLKNLNDVFFPASAIGYAVGYDGIVLKTVNAGLTWTQLNPGTNEILHSVWFVSNDTGYIGGNNAAIYKTTDGGSNWTLINNGTQSNQNIHDMHWFNSQKAFAAISQGGVHGILSTIDGGANWAKYVIGNNAPYCIDFTDLLHGHAAGTWSHIWRTTDGGLSWIKVDSNSGTNINDYNGIAFSNTNTGYAVAYDGVIKKTTNGGMSYTFDNSGTTEHLMDVYFPVDGVGYIVGYNGIILKMGGGAGIYDQTLPEVSIYPNPADDFVEVENNRVFTIISILDVRGRLMSRNNLNPGKSKINIKWLNTGVYFIRLENENKFQIQKLVIK